MTIAIVLLLGVGGYFAWKNRDKLPLGKQSKSNIQQYKPNSHGAVLLSVPVDKLRNAAQDLDKFAADVFREANKASVSEDDFIELCQGGEARLTAALNMVKGPAFYTPPLEMLATSPSTNSERDVEVWTPEQQKQVQPPRREEAKVALQRPRQQPSADPSLGRDFRSQGNTRQYPNGAQVSLPAHPVYEKKYETDPDKTGLMPPPPGRRPQQ